MYLTTNSEQDIINANAQIELNAGIPTEDGKTTCWSVPKLAYQRDDFWFIPMPPVEGWNGISQSQMMQDVINVNIEPYNRDWFPPLF